MALSKWLLMLVPLRVASQFPVCPGATSTVAPDENVTDPPVEVNVQGQSGKFTIVPRGSSGNSVGIRVTMDALREVDSAGVEVGKTGSVKHAIQSFATQAFTVGSVEQVTVNGVTAAKVSFDSPISSIGNLGVDTYLMGDSGSVGMNNDSWSVDIGDLKWNIRLWGWTWCGDAAASCRNGEVGDAVELDITVQNMGGGSASQKAGSDNTVSLGGSAELQLSSDVQTDCAWVSMADGYPMVTTQGSSTTITFRFPRFESSSLYDPVISGSCAELGLTCASEQTDTSTSDPGSGVVSTSDPGNEVDGSTSDPGNEVDGSTSDPGNEGSGTTADPGSEVNDSTTPQGSEGSGSRTAGAGVAFVAALATSASSYIA